MTGEGHAPALVVLAREILGGSDVSHIEAVIVLVHRGEPGVTRALKFTFGRK